MLADNTNLNFGGLAPRGTNNVFKKLSTKLKRHWNNSSKYLFVFFFNYTVRTESLKTFFYEDDVGTKMGWDTQLQGF